jgi:hypothetical protein
MEGNQILAGRLEVCHLMDASAVAVGDGTLAD